MKLLPIIAVFFTTGVSYGLNAKSEDLRDRLEKSFESDYKKIARYVLKQVDGIHAEGIQEHDGQPCSISFTKNAQGKAQVEFNYQPKNPQRYAERFGSESILGEKFFGTLGMSIEDLGLDLNPFRIVRRVYPSRNFDTIRFYLVGSSANYDGLVRCIIDRDAPGHHVP